MTFPETLPILDGQKQEQPQTAEEGYGPNNERLPEQLKTLLSATVRKFQTEEMYLRRREILRDWRHRLYDRGYQHLRETGGKDGGWALVTAGGLYNGSSGDSIQAPSRIDDYNIFQPFLRSFVAVHSQNPPGIVFRPKNKDSEQDLEASENAEKFRHHWDMVNDRDEIQKKAARTMGLSGRTVAWTRTVADADRFGLNERNEPKSEEITTIYGSIESKVSLFINDLCDGNYLLLMDDIDIRTAKFQNPDFASQIKPSTGVLGQSAYERIARLGVLMNSRGYTQVGEAMNHLIPRLNGFIRTRAFTGEEFDAAFAEDPSVSVGDKLKELFPEGCFVTYLGDVYVGSRNACMDDEVKIVFPLPGDGMGRMAAMEPMVVFQDRFNDGMNAAAEVFEYCWPSLWLNVEQEDLDAVNSQRSLPGTFRALKSKSGMKMEENFYREPDPEVSQSFMSWLEKLSGELPQFVLAIQPALFGAEMTDQKTASGYAQARAQAMGMQGPTWAAMKSLFASIYEDAALLAAKNPDHGETLDISGDEGGVVEMAALRKGHFGCYPDEDSSFPETTAAKRQTLTGLVGMAAQSPMGAVLFGEPENWDQIATLMGFPGLRFPPVDARRAARVDDQLLQGSPIPPSPEAIQGAVQAHAQATMAAQGAGGPMPPPFDAKAGMEELMEPSVPVNDFDYHQYEAAECQSWLNSESARSQQASNPQGFANVVLYWKKQSEAAAAAMAAMAPMPLNPAPAPKEPGKPPISEHKPTETAPAAPQGQ